MPETRRTWLRRWGPRILIAALYAGLAVMLVAFGRKFDWGEVEAALLAIPARSAILAGLFSASCFVFYTCYELLAARHTRLKLGKLQIAAIGFASYACNLALGSTLGAVGLRLRLYSARGVEPARSMSIVAFNMLTNWSGYLLVMGTTLLVLPSPAPDSWPVAGLPLRLAGAALLALLVTYLILCSRHSQRTWQWRKMKLRLPPLRRTFVQLSVAAPVWLLGSASLNALLPDVAFDLVLVSLLASALAGLIVRIPAGLGVLEATVLASLGPTVGQGQLLAALLAYRCIHYLLPLVLGLLTALGLEIHSRMHKRSFPSATRHA